MTSTIIALSALADQQYAVLLDRWATLAEAPAVPAPVSTGRHALAANVVADTLVFEAVDVADPQWPDKDQDDEPIQWPTTDPDDSALLGDHIRWGHLDFELRNALATVIEVHILRAGSWLPTALLAALESVTLRIALDPTATDGPVTISDYLRGDHLSRQVRDALGTVLDVYLALVDTYHLPTVLLASLEQVRQLVDAPRRAAAERAQDQVAGGDQR